MTVVEICVEDAVGAYLAAEAGASRAELCADLSVGGLSPSIPTVRDAIARLLRTGRTDFSLQLMVRPRAGDFVYSAGERTACENTVRDYLDEFNDSSVPIGFVFGAITEGAVDECAVSQIRELTRGYELTYHRAFDELDDPFAGLETLIALGVDRVLTSGGPGPCDVETIGRYLERSDGRIQILACGGLRSDSVARVAAALPGAQLHMRAPVVRGNTSVIAHHSTGLSTTDPREVRAIISALSADRRY
ncbi:MAG: copper homeostasis protein CutC [Actinomycetaceae bacterium]|nr:copper homeostasis protein CutC [Actinomycetaceae bacterium]